MIHTTLLKILLKELDLQQEIFVDGLKRLKIVQSMTRQTDLTVLPAEMAFTSTKKKLYVNHAVTQSLHVFDAQMMELSAMNVIMVSSSSNQTSLAGSLIVKSLVLLISVLFVRMDTSSIKDPVFVLRIVLSLSLVLRTMSKTEVVDESVQRENTMIQRTMKTASVVLRMENSNDVLLADGLAD